MYSATALLVNWQRPDNMAKVIHSLRLQSVPVEVILWNNNESDDSDYDADLQINCSENKLCYPRWLCAYFASTDFVFTLDDDLYIRTPDTIEQCIEFMKGRPVDTILGQTGVRLKEVDYWNSEHVLAPTSNDEAVDVVKGRFMFMRKKFACELPVPSETFTRGDDIYVSSFSKNKCLPAFLRTSFTELPQGEVGLCDQPDHFEKRQQALEKHWR